MGAGHRVGLGTRARVVRSGRAAARRSRHLQLAAGTRARSRRLRGSVPLDPSLLLRTTATAPPTGRANSERNCAIAAVVLSTALRDLERVQRVRTRADQSRRRALPERGPVDREPRHAQSPAVRRTVRSLPALARARRGLVGHEAARHAPRIPDLAHAARAPRHRAEHRREPADVPHGADPQRRRAARVLSPGVTPARAPAARARCHRDPCAVDAADLLLP